MDLLDSLCYRCSNCWGSTKDHKAKCSGHPSGRCDENGIPIHEMILVDYRDECEMFEEDDDWSEYRRKWCMERIKAKLKPWTSQNGEVRYYFDDWYPLISDVIEKYAQEEWMSPDLSKIKRCKVWFDKDASIHVDGIKDEMVIEIIRSNIEDRFFLRCGPLL